jgi:hypothetical protein
MSTAVLGRSTSRGACAGPAVAPPAAVPTGRRRETATHLAGGQAASLRADATRVLRVQQGRLWLTRDATAGHGSEDVVLAPGDTFTVGTGERIVVEPWDAQGATFVWVAPA